MSDILKAILGALLLTSVSFGTNVQDHCVRVEHSRLQLSFPPKLEQTQGSGICINTTCSVVATAYHVQVSAGRANLSVAGSRTKQVLSPANESDTSKTEVGNTTLFYDIANDLAFLYTTRPIGHKIGVRYSYKPYAGQRVTVAGYYHHKFEVTEAHIIGSNVPVMIGQTRLKENLVLDITVKPGMSGGAVLDEQGRLLGMVILTGVLKRANGDLADSVALPVRTLATALAKVDPSLAADVFRDMPQEKFRSPEEPSAMYEEMDVRENIDPVIPKLSAGSVEIADSVERMRAKAETGSEMMVNMIAEQCITRATGKPRCQELSIIGGQQAFREIQKHGKLGKLTTSPPGQRYGVWQENDWADMLGEIADDPWVFRGSVGNGYLFTFSATAEDDRCYFHELSRGIPLFGGNREWQGSVPCFEQVLTDREFNVSADFVEMRPPSECRTEMFHAAIYYDWVKLDGLRAPILLPVTERITGKFQGRNQLDYSTISWSKYAKFRAEHKISTPFLPVQNK